jgi:hypothetical protein
MAIQIGGTTVIDNSRNIQNVGVITATSIVSVTGIGTFGTNGTGTRTIQSGGTATGGLNGDIFYIY